MRKILSILLTALLFLTSTQLSLFGTVVYAATPFAGTVTGSTGSAEDGRLVQVTNAPNQSTLKLYYSSGGAAIQTAEKITGTAHTFKVSNFGKYYVTSTITKQDAEGNDISIESSPSATVDVRPGAVVISQDTVGPNEILVTNAIPDAELILYNDRIGYVPQTTTASINNTGKFTNVPPGLNYKAKQKINGVESPLSTETIDIKPKKVQLTASPTAGPTNNLGTISVFESTPGNTIRLYDEYKKLIDSKTADSNGGYVFTGLKAGTYYVTQVQNNAESAEEEVSIGDAEAPIIILNGLSEVTITVGDNYTDLGAKVMDNIDSEKNITGIHSITNTSSPGVYYVIFNAVDTNGNNAVEVKRKVTILPKKVLLEAVNTSKAVDPTKKDGPYGQIIVNDVYPGAILYLHQDPNGVLIRTITDATSSTYTINDVPVGKDYYVIQKYENKDNSSVVQSEPSVRVEVEDKTAPVLKLKGDDPIDLVMGDAYIEHGAIATDNIDSESELASKIQISGTVNTNIPGTYTITYRVSDKANNAATPITRTVNVKPSSVFVIGSRADMGEVSVKNAIPLAELKLYTSDGSPVAGKTYSLKVGETTHVFQNISPGSYYVTQTAGGFESTPSNIVDVVDTDRPYITLIGPDALSFVWGETKMYYNGSTHIFTDPGAIAQDYLDGDLTSEIVKKMVPEIINNKIEIPGVYTITYNVSAKEPRQNVKADEKKRTISLAPPKLKLTDIVTSKNEIEVSVNVFTDTTTTTKLYNSFNQLIDSVDADSNGGAKFSAVPAGIGYYITQTVNGIESAPSDSVNVSLFEEAEESIWLASFGFANLKASGQINQNTGAITVTVPKGTDLTRLKAVFTVVKPDKKSASVYVGSNLQTSGSTTNDFTKQLKYIISLNHNPTIKKEYTVTVVEALNNSTLIGDSISKNIGSANLLTPEEKAIAIEKGVTFLSKDKAIFVPASNVKEFASPTLTVEESKTVRGATEVNWGNSTTPFIQPIELDLPNPDKKVFARVVNENGKTYTIVQPSETKGGNLIGLITEPGTYMLIDNIGQPLIHTSTINGKTAYRFSDVSDGHIYYTTSSSAISFDRSARSTSKVESYLLGDKPSDLSNWTLYKPGEWLHLPTGELYAFTMKNNQISPITSVIETEKVEWRKNIPTYPTHKVISVTFNTKVDRKALYAGTIYVKDDAGKTVDTTLSLSADGKTILIAPKNAYTRGKQYTLHIDRQFKGNTKNKEFLKQPLTQTFFVQ